MDKLWEKRKDFEVWVPLAESREREYITNEKFDRVGYFSKHSLSMYVVDKSMKVGLYHYRWYECWCTLLIFR